MSRGQSRRRQGLAPATKLLKTMTTHHHSFKILLVAAAASLGLAASAIAQSANVAVPKPSAAPADQGLLGSAYVGFAGSYASLSGGPPGVAHGFGVYYNQPLSDGLDLTVDYNWMRARAFGLQATGQRTDAILTGFNKEEWGKPFCSLGVSGDWRHSDWAASRHSFGLLAGGGVEFQAAPAIAVAPYVNFVRQTGYNQNEFDYGVKATYRLTHDWSVTAKAQYDDIHHAPNQAEYSLGANYHF